MKKSEIYKRLYKDYSKKFINKIDLIKNKILVKNVEGYFNEKNI